MQKRRGTAVSLYSIVLNMYAAYRFQVSLKFSFTNNYAILHVAPFSSQQEGAVYSSWQCTASQVYQIFRTKVTVG